jgi:hypothetical protein
MPMVGQKYVPDTEAEAKTLGWRSLAGNRPQITPPPGSHRYRADCAKINIGDLCDAVVHPDNTAEATYCGGNQLCNRGYMSP